MSGGGAVTCYAHRADGPNVGPWERIGAWDTAERRSLWVRFTQRDVTLPLLTAANTLAVEFCAGREGDDAYVRIEPDNPAFAAILDVATTAHFAATT